MTTGLLAVPICIVDDDASVLSSLATLLDSDRLPAETFGDPVAFIDFARKQVVSLAVVDLWMPGMSGIEVQKRLHEISPGTRVIIMTGREDPELREEALDGGAVAFLTKPFDDERFLSAVRSALEGSK